MIDRVLQHLEALVRYDTRNPPRNLGTDGIFDYLQSNLRGFRFQLEDHGAGAVSLLATRGSPTLLFNMHLDTVPSSSGWTQDPFSLRVDGGRAKGLGACDIKGAAAAFLAATEKTEGPAAVLFTTDEEANDPRCVAAFLKKSHGFARVLVAEPTGAEAVVSHRGICSVRMLFRGRAGHASSADAAKASALHAAMRWGASALDEVEFLARDTFEELAGLRFNIGRVEGGIKANVIAPEAEVRFGFRPLPSHDVEALHRRFRELGSGVEIYEETFRGASFPAGKDASARRDASRDLATSLGIPIGRAVDFWTEGALFSEAGLVTLVYGPGHITEAHTADEWVALDQLDRVARKYEALTA